MLWLCSESCLKMTMAMAMTIVVATAMTMKLMSKQRCATFLSHMGERTRLMQVSPNACLRMIAAQLWIAVVLQRVCWQSKPGCTATRIFACLSLLMVMIKWMLEVAVVAVVVEVVVEVVVVLVVVVVVVEMVMITENLILTSTLIAVGMD